MKNTTRALSEIQKIRHENIANLFLVEYEDDKIYTVEEHLEGNTLEEILESGKKFTNKEIYEISISLCKALNTLHSNKIIHRDIKPSNIFLTTDNVIKLFDFGTTRIYGQSNDTTLLGTEGYAPPEQYGFSATDVRADIYALGVTLYEIIENEGFYNSFNKCRRYKNIIKKATSLDPNKRYINISKMKSAIQNYDNNRVAKGIICAVLIAGFAFLYKFNSTIIDDKYVNNYEENSTSQDDIKDDIKDDFYENEQYLLNNDQEVDLDNKEDDVIEIFDPTEDEPMQEDIVEDETIKEEIKEETSSFEEVKYVNEPSMTLKYVVNQSDEEIDGKYYLDDNGIWKFSSMEPFDDMGLYELFPNVKFVTYTIPEKHVVCEIVNNGSVAITNPTVNFSFNDVFLVGKNYYDQPYNLEFSGHVNGIGAYTVAKFTAPNLTINSGESYKFIIDLDSCAVLSENASVDVRISSAQTSAKSFNIPIKLK